MSELRHIGQYELVEKLGAGSAASVHRGRHALLGTEHAVKVLELQNPAIAQRFIREGQVQARLRHPNIVPVTDLIQEGDRVALVMDLVADGTLEERLRVEGALPINRALRMFAALLDAMAYAHGQGVLHRDIKPSNILLSGDTPHLADFGIASWTGATEKLTRAGLVMGTPGYMPPELWTDPGSADARTDVFELGALLYEMIGGRRPFIGRSLRETLDFTASGQRPDLLDLAPNCPPHVAAAVDRALNADRALRHESCAAFAAALAESTTPIPDSAPEPEENRRVRTILSAEKYRTEEALSTLNEEPFAAVAPPPAPVTVGVKRVSTPPIWRRLPTQSLVLVMTALVVGVVVYGPGSGSMTPISSPIVADKPPDPHIAKPPDPPPDPTPRDTSLLDPLPSRHTQTGRPDIPDTPDIGKTCSGWIYAALPSAPKVGGTLPLAAATNVRTDYPHEGAVENPPTRCTLPAGSRVKIRKEPVHMVGDHYWVYVSGAL